MKRIIGIFFFMTLSCGMLFDHSRGIAQSGLFAWGEKSKEQIEAEKKEQHHTNVSWQQFSSRKSECEAGNYDACEIIGWL